MHHLPPTDHPAHGMFDVADLVAIGTGEAQPYLFRDALYAARNTFSEAKAAKVKINRLYYIVLRANDALWLISVGRRGGWRREWQFEAGSKGLSSPFKIKFPAEHVRACRAAIDAHQAN